MEQRSDLGPHCLIHTNREDPDQTVPWSREIQSGSTLFDTYRRLLPGAEKSDLGPHCLIQTFFIGPEDDTTDNS